MDLKLKFNFKRKKLKTWITSVTTKIQACLFKILIFYSRKISRESFFIILYMVYDILR
jgi:hypothetical protein